jgi:thioredoxin 1
MKGKFDALISGDTPVLVDFHALWCGPCKMQAPVLSELAKEMRGQVRIIKIDVDKNQALASRFQVRGVPTLILFKNGQPVWRQSGLVQKHQLIQIFKQHTND